jgi:hypothetical protein
MKKVIGWRISTVGTPSTFVTTLRGRTVPGSRVRRDERVLSGPVSNASSAGRNADLSRPRRSGTRPPPRIRCVRGTGRTASSAVAASRVAAHSCGELGCVDRVHGMDLSAYPPREFVQGAWRRGGLWWWIYPALRSTDSISCGSHAFDTGCFGQLGSTRQFDCLRCGSRETEERLSLNIMSDYLSVPCLHRASRMNRG